MSDQSYEGKPNFEELALSELYGGLSLEKICEMKGIPPSSQNLFAEMGVTERASFFFLITQVNEKNQTRGIERE